MKFYCNKCGYSQTALLNGYRFGDVPLEGIWFVVTISTEGRVTDFQPTEQSKPFLDKVSANKHWEIMALGKETAQRMIAEDDVFTCQYCKDNAIVGDE